MGVQETTMPAISRHPVLTPTRDITTTGATNIYTNMNDGTTLWFQTATTPNRVLSAYTLATGARDSSKDITISGAGHANFMFTDGTTFWIVNRAGDGFEAFVLSSGARDSGKDFSISPFSIGSYSFAISSTLWVVDQPLGVNTHYRAFNLSTRTRDTSKDFTHRTLTGAINVSWRFTNGVNVWLRDTSYGRWVAYKLSDQSREIAKDFLIEDVTSQREYFSFGVGNIIWDVDINNSNNLLASTLSTQTQTITQSIGRVLNKETARTWLDVSGSGGGTSTGSGVDFNLPSARITKPLKLAVEEEDFWTRNERAGILRLLE